MSFISLTGKTAALLCALLGWQMHCKENNFTNMNKFAPLAAITADKCICGFIPDPNKLMSKPTIKSFKSQGKTKFQLVAKFSNLDDDFDTHSQVVNNTNDGSSPSKIVKMDSSQLEIRKRDKDLLCRHCIMSNFAKPHVPKIFYTTRTHSQVQQVVEQLKATSYRNTKMTILASRKIGCLNAEVIEQTKYMESFFKHNKTRPSTNNPTPKVSCDSTSCCEGRNSQSSSSEVLENDPRHLMDESCRALRKNYFYNLKMEKEKGEPLSEKERKPVCNLFRQKDELKYRFGELFYSGAWDIEDLKVAGRHECTGCPYYASQALYECAEIVFCPYNYVISPDIRRALDIDLTGNIVVFDEAHNLEDICRAEASLSLVTLNRLDGTIRLQIDTALQQVVECPKKVSAEHFSLLLTRLSTWMRNAAPKIPPRNIYSNTTPLPEFVAFKDDRMLKCLEEIGFGREQMEEHYYHAHVLTDEDDDDQEDSLKSSSSLSQENTQVVKFEIKSAVTRFIVKLLSTLHFLYEDDNYQHYNIVLVNNGANESKGDGQRTRQYNISMEILCLSPAIVFKAIRDQCHSIIVTSGTLSPLESFSVELKTPFNQQLVAHHVVQQYQTFCSSVNFGVNKQFALNKKGQSDETTQDDLGDTILQIVKTVPYGVLVFLPSYTFMDTLKERWSTYPVNSPTMKQLEYFKHIFYEERADKDIFEADMQRYKHLIDHPIQTSSQRGCILFAIFRGKVSEGINFTDNQARAVITIGIPFANLGAHTVACKMEYNDGRKRQAKLATTLLHNNEFNAKPVDLLTGREWYNVQAFRAMNQAFGRCIRHKGDWGAIILLDSRISFNKEKLSGWVKDALEIHNNFHGMQNKLVQFIQDRINNVIPDSSHHLDDNTIDIHECIDNHAQLTQVCTSLCLAKPKTTNILSVNLSSCSYSTHEQDNLDSSSYSLDEADCIEIPSIHDLPTQVISMQETEIMSSDDASYHSTSTSSIDMIEGTP